MSRPSVPSKKFFVDGGEREGSGRNSIIFHPRISSPGAHREIFFSTSSSLIRLDLCKPLGQYIQGQTDVNDG